MIPAHQDFITDTAAASKALVDDLYGKLSQINVLYNGAPNYDTEITQSLIDEVPAFAGLTKAELDNAVFALTAVLTAINNALPALTVLSNLP